MDYGDCELVEEIARDVYEKMFPTKRIGIYSRLLELENFLCKQPWGVRSIGIWGMPGIGKTTLAKAAFDQFSGDYEVSCFIKDFDKEFHMKGIYYLLQEYLGGTVREELDINNYVMEPEPKRVLIVLDNVCKPLDADAFLNGFDWFGPGSLIIITSRDKQVFVQCGVNQIYEVQGFNVDEAKKLFSSGIDWSKRSGLDTLEPYLRSVIQYSSGNPLALSFYGKELLPKNIEEIETELLSLKQIPPPLIMEAIKISYYTLNDSERTMFLDIACFFRGENVDYVMQLFEGCGFFPHVGISVLVDKCLVTILEGKMQMHDLIQVVAKEISNEETVQLERHCRLWDASIIQSLLEDKEPKSVGESMGIEDIEAIFLDISNLKFYVNPNAFKSMRNLRFLKIYSSNHGKHQGLGIYKSLESLPNELRLLHWENYPLNYLPHDFDPSHLVELNMPYSKLEKLWDGIKNLEMLKTIKLCHSQELVEINDISNAQNVEVIDLQGCIKFPSFPATGHLQHLRVINLSGCVEIKSFTEIQCFPRNMKELNLSDTAIRKIPSSIGHLTALEVLNLTNCKRLQHLPMGMSNLTSLVKLMLTGCSKLEHIQDLPTGLKELYLAETAIRELPSSICHLSELVVFDAENCQKLQDLPTAMGNLNSLSMLKLSGCLELEDIHDLPRNLKILNLAETPIRKMPSSFEDLTELISVDLNHCKRLQHLQMGSYKSLVRIELSGCSDLDSIIGFSLQDMGQHHIDGIEKVRLCGPPPCNVIFIWENWRTFHVIPGEKMGSKCCMKLTPFLASPYRSKLPSSFLSSLYALVSLLLSNANLLDIPQEICHFPSLKTLDLSGNDFSKLPKSMKQLCKLESLILCRCKKLKSLPELPQCLETLNAHGCVSLKNVHRSFEQFPRHCTFSNCFNISSDSVKNILDNSIAHMARHPCQNLIKAQVSSFSVPAFTGLNSIFHLQRSSSVKIRINHIIKLLGFKITVVVAFWDDSRNAASFGISVLENHMFVFCDVSMHLGIADGNDHDILDDLIVFEFVPVNGKNRVLDDCCTITECGVDVITEKTDKASHDLRRPGSALDSMELSSYVLPQFKKRKRSFSGSKDIEMEHDRLILSETNRRVASDMAPLSSSSLSPRPRYDVFLSFYEDVRRTFVSYLIKEFKWLGITAVYSGLVGCEVTSHPEVTEAIKKSRISVVILSKNYVSSSRCLNELVEIITWSKETWGYRVIPVYYEVDPSYVRKQTKTIGKGLVGTFLGKVEKPEVKWRRALTYIVDEAGESSQDWNDDTKMIEKIATNVSKQVDVMESNGFDTVFIKETEDIEEFETNIWDKLDGVHIIPSWYMYAFSLIYLCLLASQSDYITPSVYI
ncbi:BnaC03g47400D [Brassica napus]|uniref:BnaC03g47400D protein n=1 Tax=Brassica napus TaxID=3708 RepID=A0A078F476_BRANA|nr:BnaC03g47400D [Brassica napus]